MSKMTSTGVSRTRSNPVHREGMEPFLLNLASLKLLNPQYRDWASLAYSLQIGNLLDTFSSIISNETKQSSVSHKSQILNETIPTH